MAPKPTRKNLSAGPDGREPNPYVKPRAAADRAHFALRLLWLARDVADARKVLDELRKKVSSAYQDALQENPALYRQPISNWPWWRHGQADDEDLASARARRAFGRWAREYNLVDDHGSPPRWLARALQGRPVYLGIGCWPPDRKDVAPDLSIALRIHERTYAVAADEALSLDLFIAWQVLKWTWPAIRQHFGITAENGSAARKTVKRTAARLGFPLRSGKHGRPPHRQ